MSISHKLVSFSIILLLLQSTLLHAALDVDKVHVFIVAGQSNAEGGDTDSLDVEYIIGYGDRLTALIEDERYKNN